MRLDRKNHILVKISNDVFLKKYWQKKPLLIRDAIKNFKSPITEKDLFRIAQNENAISRLIEFKRGIWQVKYGPFKKLDLPKKINTPWTILVQNMNHHLPFAESFLNLFKFIPYARLDDLMVSFATKKGSVGPHFDSYDVFLFQAKGEREWKISEQKKFSLDKKSAIKIITNFKVKNTWVLKPGDLLYLPPNVGHWGVSQSDDCLTYSIGFRAPGTFEIQSKFLDFIQDNLITNKNDLYRDPNLNLQKNPAEINSNMIKKIQRIVNQLRWNTNSINNFIGQLLTEPIEGAVFETSKSMTAEVFIKDLIKKPLKLNPKTRMLFIKNNFFINGELIEADKKSIMYLKQLANDREISIKSTLNKKDLNALGIVLLPLYLSGFIDFIQ
ncbi:JmjC domain-containing protein [Candidatus Methylopumilus planktonicus]|uniref:JmjC domain-containing protein n=1 Tax=Candidatus Methylopumilus planktonicus TaxID=1581557 RepID=UPI00112458EF|nr:cupin domain-containing protein [Candidatus Methylopumilus planktonicus]QDD11258.1 cupin domain-containing protein [Candidatus Methylopumilus planktonicus]QDD23728.1 cupin domain-containing protein [Candidatus Methylopumilus planktonicus]